ncbi:N-acetylmuramoyl-L-alanine amidase [Natronospira proteinivora]|uniref:N-acetylmuramoyl-L-alanine amidase n=1 Tax=Natronospira proteinivora TaxID=1807133 RepID=A0ABT1G4J2_9GAMM|nr:N-acetylmuramoyl-L-alanine amidase [Natronospira proteinivora]MCP1726208.1 N-acetylmuramoyl-L-alanine amidase [Natronospira proteinivora]
MRSALTFLLLILVLFAPNPVQATDVEGVRLWDSPERTRVVFDLSGPVEHRLFSLSEPDRIVIDLSDARLADGFRPDGDGVVESIRSGTREENDLRVVLDLAEEARPRSFVVEPNEQYGHRLVVDLDRVQGQERAREAVRQLPSGEDRPVVIAIDPGHGGEDPGAIGPQGTREKDVVMQIARRLERLLEEEPGMEPFMIRTGDYFVSLRDRVQRARDAEADLFVSIHADAFKDPRARGASVYTLSEQGASHEAAQWLADRENSADLIGGVKLSDKDDTVASVLMDLSQSASISASLELGDRMVQQMSGNLRMHKREVMQAGFAVLKAPDIPSILVESAFISNPQEEQLLNQQEYQENVARYMLKGVRDYFWENPVPGTRIAQMVRDGDSAEREHRISRGETLSAIARKYDVSVQKIRQANSLNGDQIRVGQVLRIPTSS